MSQCEENFEARNETKKSLVNWFSKNTEFRVRGYLSM